MNDLVGHTLGQYRIIERLGKGGMATVYRAFQPSLERYVAIKVLMPYFAHEEGFSRRFVREAKAIARLDHPHILPIYDYGQEGEIHYIVMKCVDAGTLSDLEAGGPLPLELTVQILPQIAEALDHAHDQGVIHRDVKPSNVLMDRGEWVFLTDFGLARMVEGSQRLTASGVGVGTPAYMPPEQGQGRPIDRRSDVYSLGIVLYEMLTGCVPYEAETPLAVVLKHITDPLPMPRAINPGIPETVEMVILKALAKAPQDRYQTAGEMAAALCNAAECVEMVALTDFPSPEPPPPAILAEPTVREGGVVPLAADSEPHIQALESAPLSATVEAVSDVAPSPGTVETPLSVPESGVRAKPVPSGRRVPWWAYVTAVLVVLVLAAGGTWLGSGGWSKLTSRDAAPAVLGDQTPVPTSTISTEQAPTSTQAIVRSTPPPTEPGIVPRVAISVRPGVPVEGGVQRLAEFLTTRTGTELEVIAVDDREGLLGLLRAREADIALLSVTEYLWLRDGEGVPLLPALYEGPVLSGVVVVRAEGEFQSVEDLRGHPVALSSWDDLAGILGRAALMEHGLDVNQECEIVYVAPGAEPQASGEALALVNDGHVAAAIVPNLALDEIRERAPASADRLRVLAESPPTSFGVVAVQPDMPSDQISAVVVALRELDPESFRTGMPLGRLIQVDEPLADYLADALHRVDLSAWDLVAGIPPELPMPQERPPRPATASDFRIAFVPGAGPSVEGNRVAAPVLRSLQKASRDLDLELVVRETPEGGAPGDATLDLIGQGYQVIVAVGWRDPDMLWGLAREHPDVKFIHFGHWYPDALPNLIGFAYRMDQAGFLAGALAGRATETRRVAVVGGIPVPAVEHLISGFERGVGHACPECEIVVGFIDSFTDLPLGEETGRQVVEEGSDVLFNAAGGSGSAAIRSAAQQGAWVIGVDWNEYLATFRGGQVPGADHLLGSVVMRVDRQAYETIERLVRGEFEPGSFVLGVAEGGIEFLPSPESAHPRWAELERHMQEIADGLRSGELQP